MMTEDARWWNRLKAVCTSVAQLLQMWPAVAAKLLGDRCRKQLCRYSASPCSVCSFARIASFIDLAVVFRRSVPLFRHAESAPRHLSLLGWRYGCASWRWQGGMELVFLGQAKGGQEPAGAHGRCRDFWSCRAVELSGAGFIWTWLRSC